MAVKILMIDDHPSQIEGYKAILEYNDLNLSIETTPCYSCEDAWKIITNELNPTAYDFVFLDRSLPPYAAQNLLTGEDLAALIRKHLPHSKIIIITSHAEAFLLYNIVKTIEPEGLLVKSDFSAEQFLEIFSMIYSGGKYHSETVLQGIRELLSKQDYLDNYNRQIITLLSQGIKTKKIPEHLNLSLSAVEKRKAQIKDYFFIGKGGDEEIVKEARKLGFI